MEAQTCAGSRQITLLAFGYQRCYMLKVAACGQKMQKEQVGTRRIKQESERGVLGFAQPSLINSGQPLRRLLLCGPLLDLPTATFPETYSWSRAPTPTFADVGSWKISYVNVPMVDQHIFP